MNSDSDTCPCPFPAPQGWSIISLNLLEPALILLEACRQSMSFSLASLRGSLSFLLPFHCLLLAHQPGQLQPVIWSQRVSERGHAVPSPSLPEESEKCYLRVSGDPTHVGVNHSAHRVTIYKHWVSIEIHFSNVLIGEVRVSGGNLILPSRSLEKEF